MAESEPTGTGSVSDMSPADQMIKFCLDNNIQRGVIDELLDRGFDSIQALSLVDSEDLKSQQIPVGQRRLMSTSPSHYHHHAIITRYQLRKYMYNLMGESSKFPKS